MAKTNESELCQQFAMNHLTEIRVQFDQGQTELIVQSQSCPSTLSATLETIDRGLNEFVQLQQKHLSTKMNSQLKRYKAIIREGELFRNWSLDHRIAEHVNLEPESIFLSFVFFSRSALFPLEKHHRPTHTSTRSTITGPRKISSIGNTYFV